MATVLQRRSSSDLVRYACGLAFILAALITGSMISGVLGALILITLRQDAAAAITAVALSLSFLMFLRSWPDAMFWLQIAVLTSPITVPMALSLAWLARRLWRRQEHQWHPARSHRVIGGALLLALAGFGAFTVQGFGIGFNYENGSDQMPNVFRPESGPITARVTTEEGYHGHITYGVMTADGKSPAPVEVVGPNGPVPYVTGRFRPNADGLVGYFLGIPDAIYVVTSDHVLAVMPITFEDDDRVSTAWWTGGPVAAAGIGWILSAWRLKRRPSLPDTNRLTREPEPGQITPK